MRRALAGTMELASMVNAQGGTDDSGGAEIQRMVESAHEGGHADQFTGQRAATRFAAGMQLDVSTDPGVASCTMPVTMHNVSDGGFAFWSKRQFRMNSELFVREFSSDNSLPWVPAVVTHCTTGIKGYLVGAQFS